MAVRHFCITAGHAAQGTFLMGDATAAAMESIPPGLISKAMTEGISSIRDNPAHTGEPYFPDHAEQSWRECLTSPAM